MKETAKHLQELQEILVNVEKQEKQARKRAYIYTLIPIIIAGILLSYTSYRIIDARREIDRLQEKLKESTDFVRNIHQVSWMDAKVLASRYPRQSELLMRILKMKQEGIKWRLDGKSPHEGFDSPGFASYILTEFTGGTFPSTSSRLKELLRSADHPEVGDLIFYETGYTMFYFEDEEGSSFCVGMTPVGIVALKINFGPRILGYGNVMYELSNK